MRLHDAEGVELPIDGGSASLEEHASYRLTCSDAEHAWFGERLLERDGDGRFLVSVGGWAGSLALRVRRRGGLEEALRIEVIPQGSKLSPDAWARMLEDLDEWLPGITAGKEGGKHGTVQAGGSFVSGLVVALIEVVPAICIALRAITAAPRERLQGVRYSLPLHLLRSLDAGSVRSLVTNPVAVAELERHEPPTVAMVSARVSETTFDHPVNRYVVWLLGRVEATLERLVEWLALSRSEDADTAAWCSSRSAAAEEARVELVRLRRSTFLAKLRPEPPGPAALVAAQNDPTYARLQRLCRPFLSQTFRPPTDAEPDTVPVRPSYGIYELWSFLAVMRVMEHALPGLSMRVRGMKRLLTGSGSGAIAVAKAPTGTLAIAFNPVFPSYLVGRSAKRFSLSRERRPDLVITWLPTAGEARWICLDAKYRVSPHHLADAFSSAHIYRDSLIMTGYGGRSAGAWLLVPAMQPATAPFFSKVFSDRYGTGAIVLRPGADAGPALKETILQALGVPFLPDDMRTGDGHQQHHPLSISRSV